MDLMEKVTALAKRRGFVYPASEIYGGLASAYDYGPLGAALLRNIRNLWWKEFVDTREDMVGLDSSIILHPKTWEASGHVSSFTEPLVEDLVTHKRYRADHLIEASLPADSDIVVEDMNAEELKNYLKTNKIKSPDGNPLSEPKNFNSLVETSLGVVEGGKTKVYLRGETAQGIFTNFKQITDSSRLRLPFGVGQIGKVFRNEITTGQFIFRTIEFEQAEIEYFFNPEKSDWKELFDTWKENMMSFVIDTLGVSKKNVHWRRHTDKERSHYSRDTYDLDYHFPFGWKELWGVAYRSDYDLKQHQETSRVDLSFADPDTGEKTLPHVIEPAVGITRIFYMLLVEAYSEEKDRVVLKLSPKVAPFKAAIFPLLANKPELVERAREIFKDLNKLFNCSWDARGNIGKRYFAQDEIGTPWCITVDFDTLKDNTVTMRDRDTAKQKRISVDKLANYIQDKLA